MVPCAFACRNLPTVSLASRSFSASFTSPRSMCASRIVVRCRKRRASHDKAKRVSRLSNSHTRNTPDDALAVGAVGHTFDAKPIDLAAILQGGKALAKASPVLRHAARCLDRGTQLRVGGHATDELDVLEQRCHGERLA